ncbi:NAD-dependent succinate-semialdehyde dehydrogenase [Oricola sp.]|uniref:NAD-dependent succinate-semialdehyde dehydrogenase n=1 Tax=Oricola sp. TaxID=1979950 RepID=UPI0025D47E94|nr:NAD-dependent succinate-semialdehyde dehydrogenase [Oricola sp.]MCI5074195.1 NAD-dependent succinate-semialdehyde dehydrogenase [Oricola sp.]
MLDATNRYSALKLFIDGEWTDGTGDRAIAVENPSTGETLGDLPAASADDIRRAIAAAEAGFQVWRNTPVRERAALMHRAAGIIRSRAGEMAALMALELGKPVKQGPAEIGRAAEHFEWHAEQALRTFGETIPAAPGITNTALRVPVGPVAAFTPWNGPGASPARKMAAALGAGCSVVIKPAEETPATAIVLVECLVEAGLPKGVVNMLFGDPAEISAALIASRTIRMLTFTGSVPVGRHLAVEAGRHLKPCILELGGHSPVIVCEDADPLAAADASILPKFRNAGQICISPTRFFVHETIAEAFTERLIAGAEALKLGDPLGAETDVGPMIHARRRDAVHTLVSQAVEAGATLRTGGRPMEGDGYFYPPTVLTDLPDTARILTEEPFGPVALVQSFSDLDDAIERANGTDYGLAAYAFTGSSEAAARITDGVETGILSINHFGGANPEIPFGGVKDSGYGREGGSHCFDGYLVAKSVSHRTRAA